jgi:quercetin dioxygenase-like cupin family protein
MGKPAYDVYIDDKSFNVDTFWPVPKENESKSKKLPVEIVEKGWGKEIIFVNNDEYCGKLLCFEKDKKFSMHYHLIKEESWYVSEGEFEYSWIDTEKASIHSTLIGKGDVIDLEVGQPHQLKALTEGATIFEVSTKHYEEDSYRVLPGSSQL